MLLRYSLPHIPLKRLSFITRRECDVRKADVYGSHLQARECFDEHYGPALWHLPPCQHLLGHSYQWLAVLHLPQDSTTARYQAVIFIHWHALHFTQKQCTELLNYGSMSLFKCFELFD